MKHIKTIALCMCAAGIIMLTSALVRRQIFPKEYSVEQTDKVVQDQNTKLIMCLGGCALAYIVIYSLLGGKDNN